MERFEQLLAESGEHTEELEFELIKPPSTLNKTLRPYAGLPKWLGYLDTFVLFLPRLFKAASSADIVHVCDQGVALYLNLPFRLISQLHRTLSSDRDGQRPLHLSATVHDVLAIRKARGGFAQGATEQSGVMGRILQWLNFRGLCQTDALAFDSANSERELEELGCATSRSAVISIPIPEHFFSESAPQTAESIGRYFIHVGGNAWYKNRQAVIELFAELRKQPPFRDHTLILIGPPLDGAALQSAERLGLNSAIEQKTDIDDETLVQLYSNAEALIFPSHAEGFGWPPVEALAAGCPVFASPVIPSFLPDAMGELKLDAIERSARLIAEQLADAELQAERRAAFDSKREEYSLQSFAGAYAKFFEELAAYQRLR